MIPLFEKARRLPLTDTELEILEYFEKNIHRRMFSSLNQVSGELYTSNATIVRFCKKLGLRGYNEFKYQVRRELEEALRACEGRQVGGQAGGLGNPKNEGERVRTHTQPSPSAPWFPLFFN